MDFTLSKHPTTGVLSGDDLVFFYYDIGLDHLQGWPATYDWNAIVNEFKGLVDIDTCTEDQIPEHFEYNTIKFCVSNNIDIDNGSKSAAFFRHLRNAFAHYSIVREGANYRIIDGQKKITMRGLVNADVMKNFCFRFFDIREKIIKEDEDLKQTMI